MDGTLFPSDRKQHLTGKEMFCCASESGKEPKQGSMSRRHRSAKKAGRNTVIAIVLYMRVNV
jgi:hypothetical protein